MRNGFVLRGRIPRRGKHGRGRFGAGGVLIVLGGFVFLFFGGFVLRFFGGFDFLDHLAGEERRGGKIVVLLLLVFAELAEFP
jgi:hypothetical protein